MNAVVPLPAGDINGVINAIRTASLENLRDAVFLEKTLLPHLGFNNEILEEFPAELMPWCGYGVKSWQYPVQFSRYLVALSHRRIENYVEIGVRHGGTFIITLEYLRRFRNIISAVAIDIEKSDVLDKYISERPELRYIVKPSTSEEAKTVLTERQWDLVLIDGDHSFEGCWADFQTVRNHTRSVAFHDIVNAACPGVVRIWNLVSAVLPNERLQAFTGQYQEVYNRTGKTYLGIGLADIF